MDQIAISPGGGEGMGVVACLANVTSAFENGGAILRRINQRRGAAGAPPLPEWLEQSISEAPEEIERENSRGIKRFGQQFETGDLTAILSLQQVAIQLQNNLLPKLYIIEDGPVDVSPLADAVDQGRDSAITTLMALRRRLTQAERIWNQAVSEKPQAAKHMSNLSIPASPRRPPSAPPKDEEHATATLPPAPPKYEENAAVTLSPAPPKDEEHAPAIPPPTPPKDGGNAAVTLSQVSPKDEAHATATESLSLLSPNTEIQSSTDREAEHAAATESPSLLNPITEIQSPRDREVEHPAATQSPSLLNPITETQSPTERETEHAATTLSPYAEVQSLTHRYSEHASEYAPETLSPSPPSTHAEIQSPIQREVEDARVTLLPSLQSTEADIQPPVDREVEHGAATVSRWPLNLRTEIQSPTDRKVEHGTATAWRWPPRLRTAISIDREVDQGTGILGTSPPSPHAEIFSPVDREVEHENAQTESPVVERRRSSLRSVPSIPSKHDSVTSNTSESPRFLARLRHPALSNEDPTWRSTKSVSPPPRKSSIEEPSWKPPRDAVPVRKLFSEEPPPKYQKPEPVITRTFSADGQPTFHYSFYPVNSTTNNFPHPSAKNSYLGFCKSAWKLQTGDEKAMVKSKDFTQTVQSKSYFLSCSRFRCEFKGHGPDAIQNKVVTDVNLGIKYRWSFLAKSHVTMKSAEKGHYSYLCMFCVFAAQPAPVMNLTALLEHISHEHRNGDLSEVLLHRANCVNNRICNDAEAFDINLFHIDNNLPTNFQGGRVPVTYTDQLRPIQTNVELPARKSTDRNSKVFELYAHYGGAELNTGSISS